MTNAVCEIVVESSRSLRFHRLRALLHFLAKAFFQEFDFQREIRGLIREEGPYKVSSGKIRLIREKSRYVTSVIGTYGWGGESCAVSYSPHCTDLTEM